MASLSKLENISTNLKLTRGKLRPWNVHIETARHVWTKATMSNHSFDLDTRLVFDCELQYESAQHDIDFELTRQTFRALSRPIAARTKCWWETSKSRSIIDDCCLHFGAGIASGVELRERKEHPNSNQVLSVGRRSFKLMLWSNSERSLMQTNQAHQKQRKNKKIIWANADALDVKLSQSCLRSHLFEQEMCEKVKTVQGRCFCLVEPERIND